MSQRHGALFRTALKAIRRALALAALFSLFVNVLHLVVPLYMMQVFDRVLASGSFETLAYLSVIAGFSLLIMAVLDAVRARIMSRAGTWLEQRLAAETFQGAIAAALEQRPYSVEATRDLVTVRTFLASSATLSLLDTPWVPLYLLFVYLLHPLLGSIALAGALLLFALALVNEAATARALRDAGAAAREAFKRITAAARHPEAIDAMGMLPGVTNKWHRDNSASLMLQATAGDRAALILAASKFTRLGIQLAILGAGAALVLTQEITAGAMIAASIVMSRALAPVEQAIGTWKQGVAARAAFSRLRDFFDAATERETGMAMPRPKGRLGVENVSLAFPGSTQYVLRNVHFTLQPGEVLAISGPSTAGKSSLARLIVGTWKPTSGCVRLDGADVYAWNRNDFGRHVGYLPQDIELYGGTVRENIARLADADSEKIVEAARLADCHEMILRMPAGYDSEIGEAGAVLSGGQRQRIALARALLGRPRLIVLDEPDSNLDRDGEEALARAIMNMKRDGATVIVVAHRSNILRVVDKILVLRAGVVEMFGPKAEVLARLAAPREQGSRAAPAAAAKPAAMAPAAPATGGRKDP